MKPLPIHRPIVPCEALINHLKTAAREADRMGRTTTSCAIPQHLRDRYRRNPKAATARLLEVEGDEFNRGILRETFLHHLIESLVTDLYWDAADLTAESRSDLLQARRLFHIVTAKTLSKATPREVDGYAIMATKIEEYLSDHIAHLTYAFDDAGKKANHPPHHAHLCTFVALMTLFEECVDANRALMQRVLGCEIEFISTDQIYDATRHMANMARREGVFYHTTPRITLALKVIHTKLFSTSLLEKF